MTTRLPFYLVILGLLSAPSGFVPADDSPVLLAQEEEGTSAKKPGMRPGLPSVKGLKKMKKVPAVNPGAKGSRLQPSKPALRSGGTRLLRPNERSPGSSVRPPRAVETKKMENARRLRDPLKDEGRESEAETGEIKIKKEKKCRPTPPHVRVMMNFNEAEVLEIVQWISKHTCKNFIIGDGIRGGKITILSNTMVTANEAYRAFLSALNVNNMTVVKVGQFLKIQMKRDATKDTIPTYIGDEVDIPSLDQMITRVFQLKFVDANTINGTVKQLTTKDGDSYPYAPTNTLIISDTGNNMHRLMEILEQLDTPLGQEEIRVVQVEFAEAAELAQTLEEIFGEKGKGGAHSKSTRIQPVRPGKGKSTSPPSGKGAEGAGGDSATLSKVISDERTNKIILVAPGRSFPKIQALIDQLDVPIPGEGQIQVVYLQHADAEEMASTLTSLSQGTSGRPKMSSKGSSKKKGSTTKAAELFQGEVKVTADTATNSLVIVANQSDYKSLLKVVKKLDIPRRQVFVEAVIMEVNLDTQKDVGLTFHAGAAPQIGGETVPLFFGSQFKAQGSNFNSLAPNISLLGFLGGLRGPELAADESILAGISLPAFGVMLQALQTDSNVNVLSTPHILTSDNEEAEIKVGENIPIPGGYGGGYGGGMSSLAGLASMASSVTGSTSTASRYGAGGYGGIGSLLGMGMGAINRQEVGLTLKIKPQINEGNVIRMELEEELSEVKDTSNPLGPTTTKRSAKTVVAVQDQQTVVIGGLIREKIDIGETKIPVLGDIPVIGWFFRTRSQQKTKTNLLLFLTPHVIEGPEDFRAIFKRKMEERKEFIERFHGQGPEYKSFIDFRRRHGPLADIHITLQKEMKKLENGGPGTGEEIVITPEPSDATSAERTEAGKPPIEEVELPDSESEETSGDGEGKMDESDENRLEVE